MLHLHFDLVNNCWKAVWWVGKRKASGGADGDDGRASERASGGANGGKGANGG